MARIKATRDQRAHHSDVLHKQAFPVMPGDDHIVGQSPGRSRRLPYGTPPFPKICSRLLFPNRPVGDEETAEILLNEWPLSGHRIASLSVRVWLNEAVDHGRGSGCDWPGRHGDMTDLRRARGPIDIESRLSIFLSSRAQPFQTVAVPTRYWALS